MTKTLDLAATIGLGAVVLAPAPAAAQVMTLHTYIETRSRIPRKPTAYLGSGFPHMRRELEAGLKVLTGDQRTVALPEARRADMTITDGVRENVRRRLPCNGDS